MKTLLMLAAILYSGLTMAQNCEEKVLSDYITAVSQNEFHYLTGEVLSYKKGERSFESYGNVIELGFTKDVDIYFASSEYMSGLGIEALIVDANSIQKFTKFKDIKINGITSP
jgi:hypothetical protein